MELNWPLMENNITDEDIRVLIQFLKPNPYLTQSDQVCAFEREWSEWLGVRHSVFVNSGSSANLITMAILRHMLGKGEIIVPTLTWVSDIASVIQNGFRPVFVDIDSKNLCMNNDQIIEKLSDETKAVFITYAQGFNGLTERLLNALQEKGILLIEDVCEAHGATFKGKRLGSFGLISNFSFYFAHHLSTVEGGMICTDSELVYQVALLLRSHGNVREVTDEGIRSHYTKKYQDLSPDFIFAIPGYNVRNTEIGAVIGRNQLKRLDKNNERRGRNFEIFLKNLDPKKYKTDFDLDGSCNYAFNLILREPDDVLRDNIEKAFRSAGVEFRRGSSGGGNQLRQPYLRLRLPDKEYEKYPETEHIHFYGFYIGNYPGLKEEKILKLCSLLNRIES